MGLSHIHLVRVVGFWLWFLGGMCKHLNLQAGEGPEDASKEILRHPSSGGS